MALQRYEDQVTLEACKRSGDGYDTGLVDRLGFIYLTWAGCLDEIEVLIVFLSLQNIGTLLVACIWT